MSGPEEKKVLAHNYAHLRNPEAYEWIVEAIEWGWGLFDSELNSQKIHPSHEWMRDTFSILQE